MLLISFYKWWNWDLRRVNIVTSIKQLKSDRDEIKPPSPIFSPAVWLSYISLFFSFFKDFLFIFQLWILHNTKSEGIEFWKRNDK